MQVYTDLLPATKSSPNAAFDWTPADPDAPVAPGELPAAGTVRIKCKRAYCCYVVTEFPCGWDGRAFGLGKADGDTGTDREESGYDVFIGRNGQDKLCGCKGFTRHGHCKHVATVEALIANGWL